MTLRHDVHKRHNLDWKKKYIENKITEKLSHEIAIKQL